MRTIAVAVAILSACFMQEVSGDVPSATPVTEEADTTHLMEGKTQEQTQEEVIADAELAKAFDVANAANSLGAWQQTSPTSLSFVLSRPVLSRPITLSHHTVPSHSSLSHSDRHFGAEACRRAVL